MNKDKTEQDHFPQFKHPAISIIGKYQAQLQDRYLAPMLWHHMKIQLT